MRKRFRRKLWGALAAALLWGGLSACSAIPAAPEGGDLAPISDMVPPDLAPPSCNGTSSFGQLKVTILPRCDGSGGCHRTAPFAAGLDLTDASAYSSLVRVPAQGAPGLLRVAPGAAKDSFLWRKLDNELPQDGSQGQPMPLGAEFIWSPLNAAQRALVYCWIQAGAPNN